jgi:UDP-GlcNAc:undecaprenyl-phosphate GlcNAc-1-phosphate transferase
LNLSLYFPITLAGVLISFISAPLAIVIARRLKLIDVPGVSGHKRHNTPTPMAGGLVISFSIILMGLWLGWFSKQSILGILAGSIIIFLLGLMDDRIGFGAPQKLTGQVLATIVLILSGVRVQLFTNDIANIAITSFWVIGIVNAFNFVDSMDGLALGLSGIGAAFFMLVTIESDQQNLAIFSAGLLGICIGVYFYNLSPAKTFLGDSGSQQLGFLLAAIGIAYNPVDLPAISSWFVPIMVLGVPIFDTALVTFSRIRRGVPIYHAAWDHTYHRLCSLGLEPERAVFAMHLMAIVLGFSSFIALKTKPIIGNIIFGSSVLFGIALIAIFEFRKRKE